MEKTGRKRYDLIDVLKFIGSILIFAMHADALRSVNPTAQFYGVQLLARWGVPFFFTVSAFLLFSKAENGNITGTQWAHYAKRIALLYAVWFLINLPYIFYVRILSKGVTSWLTWVLFLKNALVESTFMGSWYLVSCVVGSWFVYILSKKLSSVRVLIFTFLLYLPCVLTSAYGGIFPPNALRAFEKYVFSPCNSLICGCFFFAFGKFVAEKREVFQKVPAWASLLGTLVSFALYYLEISLLKSCGLLRSTDSAFALIFVSFFVAVLCSNDQHEIKGATLLRKASTVIYCGQGIVLLVASFFSKIFLHNANSVIVFAVACFITLAEIVVVLFAQNKMKWKWTKYLT